MMRWRIPSQGRSLLVGGIVVASVWVAYRNSFTGAFVYLDDSAVRDNPTIRSLWPISRVLAPPADGGLTVGGRPMVNLSLAINYAIGGVRVWGYHAFNVAVHALAALTLFGIVRRTATQMPRGPAHPDRFAFALALLWSLHPLQTESVTYIIQRAESLMGLCYLLTLYCFIRGVDGAMPAGSLAARDGMGADEKAGGRTGCLWFGAGWAACLCGVATKEVMVSAPVIVLLYDRTFVAGSFQLAWRARWRYYAALGSTWLLLVWLVASTGGNRGGTSGFGLGISWGRYLLTQGPAILHYLRLAFWPHPLIFYYPVQWVRGAAAWSESLLVLLLLAATLYGLWRRSVIAFLAAWFFAILAPTSLIPGLSQTMAEHRMYLPLAAVIAACLIVIRGAIGEARPARNAYFAALAAAAAGLGWLTDRRNRDYRSEIALWSDTVAKAPASPYTQNNLGIALADAGRYPEAIVHLTRAVKLNPNYAAAWDNLGLALARAGRLAEAISGYEQALRLKPDYAQACANLGVALAEAGRLPEAIDRLRRAVELSPGYVAARNDLAVALASSGRPEEAIEQYEQALQREPKNSEAHYNLGNALAETNRWPEAIIQYQSAVSLKPAYPEAWANLGVALARTGRLTEAVAGYERALSLAPNDAEVEYNLALALRALGRSAEAQSHFEAARRLQPGG